MPNPTTPSWGYGQGQYSSGIGNYTNLPQGISNAGGGANNAYVRDVQPNELTSYNLNRLTQYNSPYMQQARQSGLDQANSRGLLNGSMAAGSAARAAIQAGLPIAQADASAYGTAAGQNLDALNSILATGMNNATSRYGADAAAGASMYNADLDYRLGNRRIDFEGEQAGLGRGFQDYMARQGYDNQMRRDAFNLGGSLLMGDQNFTHNMYLNNSDNPFAISDPESFQGYIDWANQNSGSYYDNLFNYSTNGGQPIPGWSEQSQWYTTPGQQPAMPAYTGRGG